MAVPPASLTIVRGPADGQAAAAGGLPRLTMRRGVVLFCLLVSVSVWAQQDMMKEAADLLTLFLRIVDSKPPTTGRDCYALIRRPRQALEDFKPANPADPAVPAPTPPPMTAAEAAGALLSKFFTLADAQPPRNQNDCLNLLRPAEQGLEQFKSAHPGHP